MRRALALLFLSALTAGGRAQTTFETRLTHPAPLYDDSFGRTLSTFDDAGDEGHSPLLLLGMPDGGERPGFGHLFLYRRRPDSTWAVEADLFGDPSEGGRYGEATAAARAGATRLLLVGVSGGNRQSSVYGTAHAWQRDGGPDRPWSREAIFFPDPRLPERPGSGFGAAVALATHQAPGDTLVVAAVGAPGGDLFGPNVNVGSVYVYRREAVRMVRGDSAVWVEEDRLFTPTRQTFDEFGSCLALTALPSGEAVLLAGAPEHDDVEGLGEGRTFVFRRDPTTGQWAFEAALVGSTTVSHDAFGCADAVPLPSPGGAPTDTLVAVATAPEAASQAGRAYAFRRAPDGQGGYIWTEEAVLRASPSGSGLNFGQSVAVYPGGEPSPGGVPGDPQQVRALVGTLSQEPSIQEAAFLFVRQPGGAWGQPARLTSGVPPPERLDFGFSVALSQTHAFVGAPATDLPGSPEVEEAGSVYVFGSPPTTSTEPEVPASPLTLSVSPNPARGAATVTLTLTRPSPVEVAVYDALGRRVAPLHDGPLAAGPHAFTVRRAALPPGVYFVRARGEGASASRPLTVLR